MVKTALAVGPRVFVFVHPVDTQRYPTVPPGWRWCVQLSEDPTDPLVWLNAGWGPTANEAELDGATVGVTVARGFQLAFGVKCRHEVRRLETDPTTVDVVFQEQPRSA